MNRKRAGNFCLVSSLVFCAVGAFAYESKPYNMAPKAMKSASSMAGSVAAPQASLGAMLDDFEANDWAPSTGEGATLRSSHVEGKTGKGLYLEYDLKDTKQWVSLVKEIPMAGYNGKALQFWLKCAGKTNNLEVKLIDEDGTNYGYKLPTKTLDWQLVTIDLVDLSYWWGGDSKLGFVKQISFAVSQVEGGAGTVLIDELKLIPSGKKFIKEGVVDSCDTVMGWKSEGDLGAMQSLSVIPGKDKDAVLLNFDLGNANWVQMYKMVPMEFTPQSVLTFWIRWTGDKNILEVKVADKDDSNFGKKYESIAKPGEWQEIRIPVSELTYLYGGDKDLNMQYIKGIWLAVSRDKGGKGMLAVDNIMLK